MKKEKVKEGDRVFIDQESDLFYLVAKKQNGKCDLKLDFKEDEIKHYQEIMSKSHEKNHSFSEEDLRIAFKVSYESHLFNIDESRLTLV